MSDRPVEPHNASENPEAWAEIAQWESDRADILREALERISLIAVESYPGTIKEYAEDMNGIITLAQNALSDHARAALGPQAEASGEDNGGWTLPFAYLVRVQEEMDQEYRVGLEEIEAVLLSTRQPEKTVPMELVERLRYQGIHTREWIVELFAKFGYTVTESAESAKTVPMEMLIAVRQDVPVCATRDQLRRIAAKYGYKVEEKP